MAKKIILLLWAIILGSLFIPYPWDLNTILPYAGLVVLGIHLAEFLIFKKTVDANGDDAMKAFWMTMVYGVAYIRGID